MQARKCASARAGSCSKHPVPVTRVHVLRITETHGLAPRTGGATVHFPLPPERHALCMTRAWHSCRQPHWPVAMHACRAAAAALPPCQLQAAQADCAQAPNGEAHGGGRGALRTLGGLHGVTHAMQSCWLAGDSQQQHDACDCTQEEHACACVHHHTDRACLTRVVVHAWFQGCVGCGVRCSVLCLMQRQCLLWGCRRHGFMWHWRHGLRCQDEQLQVKVRPACGGFPSDALSGS